MNLSRYSVPFLFASTPRIVSSTLSATSGTFGTCRRPSSCLAAFHHNTFHHPTQRHTERRVDVGRHIRHTLLSTTSTITTARTMSSNSSDEKVKVALLQFKVSASKSKNHEVAKSYLTDAASQGAQLAVLPEIWNGPYATAAFGDTAEVLPDVGYQYIHDDDGIMISPSAKVLFQQAIEHGMYIVGGSISEVVKQDNDANTKIYNTCLIINPEGKLVGKHRKVHLFDIDVPGKITFKESDTLSPGTGITSFDAGEPFGRIGVGIW